MDTEEQKNLWRWAVHNRAFEVEQTIAEIRSTALALGGPTCLVHDKWIILERQLRICAQEVKNLKTAVGRIDFEPVVTPL